MIGPLRFFLERARSGETPSTRPEALATGGQGRIKQPPDGVGEALYGVRHD